MTLSKTEILHKLNNLIPGSTIIDSFPETNIYFKQIEESDIEDFHKYSLNPKLYEFFEFDAFKSMNDTQNYFNKMKSRIQNQTHYYWFIKLKEDNRLIGTAALADINYERQSVQWGKGIDPELWGNNYNIEIQELLKHYIFEILEFNRLYGITMINNRRTIASVKSSGCMFEGILKDHYKKNGVYIDGWAYSLLAKQYFNNLEISGDNFDDNTYHDIEKILKVLSTVIINEEIDELTTMNSCASWDSLAHMEVITAISNEFSITIKPKHIPLLTSIKEIYEFVNS